MNLKHTETFNTLPDLEKSIATDLYSAYKKTLEIKFNHPNLEQLRHCLNVLTRNRNEVQLNLNAFKEGQREVTNPKPAVALLQPQEARPQVQQGHILSEIPTNLHNPNEQPKDQDSEPQNEVVAVGRGRKKMHKAPPVLRFGTRAS